MNDDLAGRIGPDPGLRIDPVRVGARRPRLAILVAAVAVAFVATALVKPWQAGSTASRLPPATAPFLAAPPPPNPFAFPIAPSDSGAAESLVASAAGHDEWGIRALVLDGTRREPGATALRDTWQPLAVPTDSAFPNPTLGLERGVGAPGVTVRAVEMTTPRDTLALDVRFWRIDGEAGAHRVLPIPIPGPEAGSWLWLPDPRDAAIADGWPTGDYQIDILVARRVIQVITHIQGDASPPQQQPTPGAASSIAVLQALSTFPPGLFAFGPSSVERVAVESGPPLNEAQAWLGPVTAPGLDAHLGRIVGDPIDGVGVLLAPGQTVITAELERVSPAMDIPPTRIVEVRGLDGHGTTIGPAVTLVPPPGLALADGLYHLIVAFRDANGRAGASTWTFEILPGEPPVRPRQALVQIRDLDGILRSTSSRPSSGPSVTDADLGGGDGDGTCGGLARVRSTDEMIALRTNPADDIRDLRLVPIDTIRRVDVPIRFATEVLDGLSMIALPAGGIAARPYALLATIGAGPTRTERQYTVCVR